MLYEIFIEFRTFACYNTDRTKGVLTIRTLTTIFPVGAVSCQIARMHAQIDLPGQGSSLLPMHKHIHLELHYVSRGECAFWVGHSSITLQTGQLLLIPPGVFHHMHSFSPDLARTAIPVTLTLPDNAPGTDRYFYQTLYNRSPSVMDVAGTPLEDAIRRVIDLIRQKEYRNLYVQEGRERAFCSLLLLELFEHLDIRGEKNSLSSEAAPSRPFQIDEWLSVCYNKNISADALAKKLNISPRQLNRVMKQTYGLSFRDKIAQLRTEVAVTLLTTTNRSVASIAEELGYDSPSNFTVFIKKSTGRTPSQIRRESR